MGRCAKAEAAGRGVQQAGGQWVERTDEGRPPGTWAGDQRLTREKVGRVSCPQLSWLEAVPYRQGTSGDLHENGQQIPKEKDLRQPEYNVQWTWMALKAGVPHWLQKVKQVALQRVGTVHPTHITTSSDSWEPWWIKSTCGSLSTSPPCSPLGQRGSVSKGQTPSHNNSILWETAFSWEPNMLLQTTQVPLPRSSLSGRRSL